MKPREAERIIKDDGWYYDHAKGSHRHYKHPTKKGLVTIPWHNKDIDKKTLESIFKQAQIKR